MKFLEALEKVNNFTTTENGAVALSSTGSAVLDAFGTLGGYQQLLNVNDYTYGSYAIKNVLDTFYQAFYEDKALAMKLLFYMRDIRGGQGCRTLFRVIMASLAKRHPEYVINNFDNFLFYGRGDDLLCLIDTPVEEEVISYIKDVLYEDLASVENGGGCSLLAKWLPSENASSKETKYYANKIIKGLDIKPSKYRKMLSKLRKSIGIVETLMSQNRWEEIDFEKLPSRASMIYSNAFVNHVKENYLEYLQKVAAGDAKINAGALIPYDIVHRILKGMNWYTYEAVNTKDEYLLDALWKALPDYFAQSGMEETGICVVDTSGSMLGTPLEVALSLGLYCADKAKGPFKDHFITFSRRPKLQKIVGDTVVRKINCMQSADWGMNTNIKAVFDLILETAIQYNVPKEELPNKLYIISDMQFDEGVCDDSADGPLWSYRPTIKNSTLMQDIAKKFEAYGYDMPAIVYWNVRPSFCGMFQEDRCGANCCMVSGYSPSLFKAVLLGTEYEEVINDDGKVSTKVKLDPMTIMLNTLNNERYDNVWVGEDN